MYAQPRWQTSDPAWTRTQYIPLSFEPQLDRKSHRGRPIYSVTAMTMTVAYVLADTRHRPDAGLILAQRRRRWADIRPALCWSLVSVGTRSSHADRPAWKQMFRAWPTCRSTPLMWTSIFPHASAYRRSLAVSGTIISYSVYVVILGVCLRFKPHWMFQIYK